jgi:ankyrin repeat protein
MLCDFLGPNPSTMPKSTPDRASYHYHASGDARQLIGDVHNITNIHKYPQSGLSDQEQTRARHIESLRFDELSARRDEIKEAHATTCQWLLKNPVYTTWLDQEKLSEHHGLLWLKGKPGTGKSTLMKFALDKSKEFGVDAVRISFFFHARSTKVEQKSTSGMYRSLLYQLFTNQPSTLDVFNEMNVLEDLPPQGGTWKVPQLTRLLRNTLRKLTQQSVFIFVDALDECDEEEVREMVEFFESLGNDSVAGKFSDNRLFVCFSSRHYPSIKIAKSVELVLEKQIGHDNDIIAYTYARLKIGEGDLQDRIRAAVLKRASGVFLWVELVVNILNRARDHGGMETLEARLDRLPSKLNNLFENILAQKNIDGDEKEEEDQGRKLCLQWILFARQPLTAKQLYYACRSGIDSAELSICDPRNNSLENMRLFMNSSSMGLAELTTSRPPTVQFIHESVRDFLLSRNGLNYFGHESLREFAGNAHDTLKVCCGVYLRFTSSRKQEREEEAFSSDFPFAQYAVKHILYHAELAMAYSVSQSAFIRKFGDTEWMRWKNLATKWDSEASTASLLLVLAVNNLANLISLWLQFNPCADIVSGFRDFTSTDLLSFISSSTQSPSDVLASSGSPLGTALALRHTRAIKALLTPPENSRMALSDDSFRPPTDDEIHELCKAYPYHALWGSCQSTNPTLWFFLQTNDRTLVLILLRSKIYDINEKISTPWFFSLSPLSYVAREGQEKLVKFLLQNYTPDIESWDAKNRTPLSLATQRGHRNVARLLLDADCNTNSRCSSGRTPLSYAAEEGHDSVIRELLFTKKDERLCKRKNVNIDCPDNKHQTPLFYAASKGHASVVECLIQTGQVNVNCKSDSQHTPLSFSTLHGYAEIVKILCGIKEIDVNIEDIHGRTPLSHAAEFGHSEIVRLFLDRKDVQLQHRDNRQRTAISYAASRGHASIVEWLLSHSDNDIAGQDRNGLTPLIHAIENNHIKVVRLLLDAHKLETPDFNIHATDGHGGLSARDFAGSKNKELISILESHCGCEICLDRALYEDVED